MGNVILKEPVVESPRGGKDDPVRHVWGLQTVPVPILRNAAECRRRFGRKCRKGRNRLKPCRLYRLYFEVLRTSTCQAIACENGLILL
jgi:hypothetical protein